ncbi:alpha/beta hydrolase-fold protein [Mycobacterium seoulense]|uniref:alpha/beta hydrolase-fold protein n=1 Tax=Mycobacterium seoulense TaxID=386911 RepID=UPI003CF07274
MMARMPDLSRRALLGLGAGAAAGAMGTYGLDILFKPRPSQALPLSPADAPAPLAPPPTAPLEPAPPGQPAPTMVTGSFVSAARGGINTNWAIARPPGQTKALRPVIALHGKGSDASTVMAGGVEQGLAQAVNAGLPPFAVVAVDGGGSYWHKRTSGEDSGAMVLDELIPMLGGQNLDTSRVAFLGWSMGGYGALLLGGRLGPARTAAICAVSPALWLSPGAAAPGAFDGPDDFAANSVFGMPALASIPIRVDCGDSDPFYAATKQFIAQLPRPPAGGFSPGGHNGEFWSSQLPAELTWMAPLLTA